MSFSPSITPLLAVLRHHGYAYAARDDAFFLNLVGIRTREPRPARFDDFLTAFYRTNGTWILNVFAATTDPGLFWLRNPMSPRGAAVLKEGQYRDAYRLGHHRGRYKALVQQRSVTVVRDANRDEHLDLASGSEEAGIFGINIHRASARNRPMDVEKWSAGCQVVACPRQFSLLMEMCEEHRNLHGNRFTYTLVHERDFEQAVRADRMRARPTVPLDSRNAGGGLPAPMARSVGG